MPLYQPTPGHVVQETGTTETPLSPANTCPCGPGDQTTEQVVQRYLYPHQVPPAHVSDFKQNKKNITSRQKTTTTKPGLKAALIDFYGNNNKDQ